MALGGYQGWDRILTPQQLAGLVADGAVRFFYLSGEGGALPGGPDGGPLPTQAGPQVVSGCQTQPMRSWRCQRP